MNLSKLVAFLGAAALTVVLPALAATFNLFQPATGLLVGSSSTFVTTAATSSNVRSLWSGTCDGTTFLRGDGACAAPGGGGSTYLGADGSAGSPTFSFTNYPTVGLFNGGTPNTLGLATNGVQRIGVQDSAITLNASGSTAELTVGAGTVGVSGSLSTNGTDISASTGFLTVPSTAGNGCAASSQTGSGYFQQIGVAVFFQLQVSCATSDATTWQIGPSVFPSGSRPSSTTVMAAVATDNGVADYVAATLSIGTGGAATVSLESTGGGWTATGVKTVVVQGFFDTIF